MSEREVVSMILGRSKKTVLYLISSFFLFTLAGCPHQQVAEIHTNSYAVIIGIEKYRDLPTVDFAANDARAIELVLTTRMGFSQKNVFKLVNEKATRGDIKKALEVWLANNVNSDSRVFIFYAGHGAPNPSGETFIVPYDGDPGYLTSTAYSLRDLNDSLQRLPTTDITMVIDACFSGTGGRSVIAKGSRPLVMVKDSSLAHQKNAVVFSAAQKNQISTSFPEVEHGLLTYYFLKGIQGEADNDSDGDVDVSELFDYIKPNVSIQAKRQNVVQVPELTGAVEKHASTVLARNPAGLPRVRTEGSLLKKKKQPNLPPPGF